MDGESTNIGPREASGMSPRDETRHHFHDTLDHIREGIVEVGALIVENARRAGVAITENRMELIPEVVAADQEVNSECARLEAMTFETLALQQPVAGDLRFLVSATRITYELERCGDLVVNLANVLDRMNGFPDSPRLRALVERVIEASTGLFARSMVVFQALDAEGGARLDREDDLVDDLVSDLYREIGRESDRIGLESGIALTRMGRFLERIADHGVNVGEHTTYIITSHFPAESQTAHPSESE